MVVAAKGVPAMVVDCRDACRRCALGRRRQRGEHVRRPRHRCGDASHPASADRHRRRHSAAAVVFSIALEARRIPAALAGRQPLLGPAGLGCGALLRLRLLDRPEAPLDSEHRHRRRHQERSRCWWVGPRSPTNWRGRRLVLFAMIVIWTPSHFWALAVRYRDDYETANVPMVAGGSALRDGWPARSSGTRWRWW